MDNNCESMFLLCTVQWIRYLRMTKPLSHFRSTLSHPEPRNSHTHTDHPATPLTPIRIFIYKQHFMADSRFRHPATTPTKTTRSWAAQQSHPGLSSHLTYPVQPYPVINNNWLPARVAITDKYKYSFLKLFDWQIQNDCFSLSMQRSQLFSPQLLRSSHTLERGLPIQITGDHIYINGRFHYWYGATAEGRIRYNPNTQLIITVSCNILITCNVSNDEWGIIGKI